MLSVIISIGISIMIVVILSYVTLLAGAVIPFKTVDGYTCGNSATALVQSLSRHMTGEVAARNHAIGSGKTIALAEP